MPPSHRARASQRGATGAVRAPPSDYLQLSCGPYRILVHAANVIGVEPDGEFQLSPSTLRQARRLAWPLVIDARTLLGLGTVASGRGVKIHWRPMQDTALAILVVDRVDSLRSGADGDFRPLPRVPRAFHALFDRVCLEDNALFSLCLRQDIRLQLDDWGSRRRFCSAVLGACPPEAGPVAF